MQNYDVAVIGGGLGGVAAALAALRNGRRVFLSEQFAWIGGQMTSQAVPPDEHPWIESFGSTDSYRKLRDDIRQYYRDHYPLKPEVRGNPRFNPGNAFVSTICHEPKVSLAVLTSYLLPYLGSGRLTLATPYRPISVDKAVDRIESVTLQRVGGSDTLTVSAPFVIDATEIGDLLALADVPFRTGAESAAQFSEPSAPEEADPEDVQSVSWCFVVDYDPEGEHVIPEPAQWKKWRDYDPQLTPSWGSKMLSWSATHPITLEPVVRTFDPINPKPERGPMDLWTFRRIADKANFRDGFYDSDIVLVNWPQIDYVEGNIIGRSYEEQQRMLGEARQQSLSMLYWMQTEAPRPDGGRGWPGLRLRGDITEGPEGLAMAPYIREGRRIVGLETVTENHVGVDARESQGKGGKAHAFHDSVGVGAYRIDLHPSTAHKNYLDVGALPFQIPLGALFGEACQNLLAGAKNISTTHITNGCYRLHPVEWNVGEVAGLLAHFCLSEEVTPSQARDSKLKSFQEFLYLQGVQLEWPALQAL
jgi:FAD-dependent oxidoreductase family protein